MDDQTGAFFQPMDDAPTSEEPIILGAPMDDFAGGGDYLGEIDAAPPAVLIPEEPQAFAAPVIVAPGVEEVDDEDDYEEPVAASEPSPMTVWNDSWQVTLKERKDEENAQKGSSVEAAEAELSKFAAQRDAKREARMQTNRADEQDKLEAIEADLENDNSWQRVVKMVELNQDAAEGSLDCTRMKDVLILLKNDADRAAILA